MGSIDHIGSNVDHVWHNRLIHRTIPLYISRLSLSVSISILMILMEDGGLSGSPFSVSIGYVGVSGENPT